MPLRPEDDTSSLEKARERLYKPRGLPPEHPALSPRESRALPHTWETTPLAPLPPPGKEHLHLARTFLFIAGGFFIVSLGIAGYIFYFGGNSVSVDKVTIELQGPTTIAGGDIVPLSLIITNRNPVAIENAVVEVAFPSGTLTADESLAPYPRYTENLGTLKSGETITRSIKAIVFGGAGQELMLPVTLSYGTSGSAADFVKKSSHVLAISSTPLSISVDTLSETVSGKPLTFTLIVRSNAPVPLENVVVLGSFPFGFSVTNSSPSVTGSNFLLGTLAPGASKTLTLTGTLTGQDGEERVFRFTVGTAKVPRDLTSVIPYMTQDATLAITAPFIATTISLNGETNPNAVVAPGSTQSVTVSYTNTLDTTITNATVAITLSGSAIDYDSIETNNGFYRSSNRTIFFSRDTDPTLSALPPGASGIGTFTFSTLEANKLPSSPSITLTISVSGTREGQSNVPEEVNATMTKTIRVAAAVAFSARSLHNSGPIANTGPIPPRVDTPTTYSVVWNISNKGSAIADSAVTATLPSYITYTNKTSGNGTFSYDEKSRTVSWRVGDVSQGGSAQGVFQVSLTPSSSQVGEAPALTNTARFSGFDRFAGVDVSATAEPVTIETKGDSGYSSSDGTVQNMQ